jgi:hypothetical protein
MVAGTAGGVEVTAVRTAAPIAQTTQQTTMVQLLRRNATVIQVLFALLWSARFVVAVGAPEVPLIVGVVGALSIRLAFRSTRGPRARDVFGTPEGRRFLRPVTWLTIAQIVGSVVLPIIVGMFGAEEWVLPSVALTIGLFLVGFSRSLRVRAVGHIGAAATVLSLSLPLVASGDALLALIATSMMVALLASTWFCGVAARSDGDPAARLHTAFTLGQRG